jgi:hypothetical protein
MITNLIGRTFLEAYNKKYQKNYSPKDFFEKEYFEVFFNHVKYMQWVTNSPFVQMKKGQEPELLSVADRKEKLSNLHEKIKEEEPDASFALGYPASEAKDYASTSGQVSDVLIPVSDDEIYLSWIGSGLGIGVAGGYNLLFNDAEITLNTFEGWKVYRKYLNDRTLDKMRGNQVNSWNGQWLRYFLGGDFQEDFDFSRLLDEDIFKVESSLIEVNTVNWSLLFFSLSQLYPDKELTAYVYSFGQTNKTIGFIPFQLKSGTRILDIYKKLYGDFTATNKKEFESLFGIHIKRACELGNIGIQALRPQELKKYMSDSKNLSFKKEEDNIIYHAYKTWLIAMLSKNKEEIKDYTLELAGSILKYRNSGKGNSRITLVENELFGSKSKRGFIESLTIMLSEVEDDDLLRFKNLKDEIHLMTNEEFGYFCTLLKFDYAFVKKQS